MTCLNLLILLLDVHCFNWSLTLESSLIANPMQEFTPFSADRLVDVNKMYTDFKKDHGKVYDDEKEHTKRKHIYKHNMRSVTKLNICLIMRESWHFSIFFTLNSRVINRVRLAVDEWSGPTVPVTFMARILHLGLLVWKHSY